MIVDLRSDTVTKPTPEMLKFMWDAQVGDDVFGEDPSVKSLEERIAHYFGKEAGLFCPSGTMTNQIAIKIHTQPQDEVICHKWSHIYRYEGGGMMYNSLVSVKLLEGERGIIQANDILHAINPNDVHYPSTRLVSLENSMNKGGGSVYPLSTQQEIARLCKSKGLALHLDGARIFNALAVSDYTSKQIGEWFDTISICFSKGLGAPIGSVLVGNLEAITRAKRIRKVLGGGMRQAGYMAAACLYALDHHIDRLVNDHKRAKEIEIQLSKISWVNEVMPVETNIVIASVDNIYTETEWVKKLKEKGILAVPFGQGLIRFVTHLDITDRHIDFFSKALLKIA